MPRTPSTERSAGCSVAAAAIESERDEQAADAERADERHRHEEQQREPDRDGRTGEDDGAAGGRHRADDRVVDVARRAELLPEAVDDEERVVDGEPEADELDEVRDVADHRDGVREREDDARASPVIVQAANAKRHEHREREAEHGEEHGERDRQRDRLAAQQVVREHGLEVVLDRRLAGHVRARLARERAPHGRRVALRVLEVERRVDLAVEEAAVGAQLRRRARPGRASRRRRGAVCARARGRCGRAEDDGEDAVGPLAEVVLEDLARASRTPCRAR